MTKASDDVHAPTAATTEPPLVARAPAPGTALYRHFGDARAGLLGPHALLLQVMHPVVDAGVLQHSRFKTEPFSRLIGTVRSMATLVYGGVDGAAAESRRLRKLHTLIRGVDKSGQKYHSLDPSAWTWVYATLVKGSIDSQMRFGKPLPRSVVEDYYRGARELGLVMGVRHQDLPETWDAFEAYFAATIDAKLVDTESARDVLRFLGQLPRPFFVPRPIWRLSTWPIVHVIRLVTVGTLPDVIRQRLTLAWSERDQRALGRFTVLAKFVSAITPNAFMTLGTRILGRFNGRLVLRAESHPTT